MQWREGVARVGNSAQQSEGSWPESGDRECRGKSEFANSKPIHVLEVGAFILWSILSIFSAMPNPPPTGAQDVIHAFSLNFLSVVNLLWGTLAPRLWVWALESVTDSQHDSGQVCVILLFYTSWLTFIKCRFFFPHTLWISELEGLITI